jgi:type IV pilus assembly protein PilZ
MAEAPDRPAAGTGGARPGVLSLSIKEKSALYAAYMPYLKHGGIFIPTTKQYKLGDEVFMLLTLMSDPNKIPVAGKVVWITPSGAQGGKTQGIGVEFAANESGIAARNKIEGLLGGSLKSTRPTHTM